MTRGNHPHQAQYAESAGPMSRDDELEIATQQLQAFPSPQPLEISSIASPPAENEQIVNIGFVMFRHAISFHFPSLSCQWTSAQHMYGFSSGDITFTAKVDGHLETKDKPLKNKRATKATVGVRPYLRSLKEPYVRYEESAQMAALIFSEQGEEVNDGQAY